MKRVLLLLLFIPLFHIEIKAQFNLYHPFPDSNAVWAQDSSNCSCGEGCGSVTYDYIVKGDTVVNSLTYHKVYKNGGSISWCGLNGVGYFYSYKFYGAYREDTSRHIYACCTPYLGSHDSLLYDFNMSVGDTLKQYITHGQLGGQPFIVHSIDSTLVGGVYRKRFNIKAGTDSIIGFAPSIIEGIGSTQGLFEFLYVPFEIGTRLDCFSQNDTTDWPNHTNGGCPKYYLNVPTIKEQDNTISVYPNPTKGIINLSITGYPLGIKNITRIYNMLGEEIYSSTLNITKTQIDFSGKPNGVYLYRVLSETGDLVSSGKFVIQK